MYVEAYETLVINQRFLQHVLFYHVCDRSLCIIFVKFGLSSLSDYFESFPVSLANTDISFIFWQKRAQKLQKNCELYLFIIFHILVKISLGYSAVLAGLYWVTWRVKANRPRTREKNILSHHARQSLKQICVFQAVSGKMSGEEWGLRGGGEGWGCQ